MSRRDEPPTVSVITIFLDGKLFLEEAIESVRAQTYGSWELLLVDDGSTDGSTELARRYAELYPENIRYFEHADHQNRGKSTSRNLGIEEARGRYLTFLDADDVFLPSKLERQVALLDANPAAAMVYGRTLYWFGWTGKASDRKRDFVAPLGVRPGTMYDPPRLLNQFLRRGGTVPCICGLLARREPVVRLGGFDETIQDLYEDQVFLVKLCLDAPVFVEDGCGEMYRQHLDSTSHQAVRAGQYHRWKPNPARGVFLDWLNDYIERSGIEDQALRRSMQAELRPYRYPVWGILTSPFIQAYRSVASVFEAQTERVRVRR